MMLMSWKSITIPLTVIIVGVIFTIAALSSPEQRTEIGTRKQNVALEVTHSPAQCAAYPNSDVPDPPEDCLALTTTPQTTGTPTTSGTVTPAGASTSTATATASVAATTVPP